MSVGEVLHQVERDRVFHDESGGGVTLSGGEPLQQPDFAEALLRGCRVRGIHTAVDTCGYVPTTVFGSVAEFVDLFLFDVKLMDSARHQEYTGVTNELILKNLEWLVANKSNVILRVPVIPSCTDDEANISAIVRLAKSHGLTRISLLPYHQIARDKYRRLGLTYKMGTKQTPSNARMQAIARSFEREGLDAHIGG